MRTIAAKLRGGVAASYVADLLEKAGPPAGAHFQRLAGEGVEARWCVKNGKAPPEEPLSAALLREQLMPIIEVLREQSRKAPGTVSGATIDQQAGMLEQLLSRWCRLLDALAAEPVERKAAG